MIKARFAMINDERCARHEDNLKVHISLNLAVESTRTHRRNMAAFILIKVKRRDVRGREQFSIKFPLSLE